MIYVDRRVGSAELESPLQAALGPKLVSKIELPSADFCWDGNGPNGVVPVGVERKVIDDALNSIRTGRLAQQVADMSKFYRFIYVVIEGLYRPNKQGHLEVYRRGGWVTLMHGPNHYLYGELSLALNSFSLCANVIVLRSSGVMETVKLLTDLYHWWQKDWEGHQAHQAIKMQGDVLLGRASLLRRLAAELPGIGWVRSRDVEKHFQSVSQMVNAGPDEWSQIDGIGPKTADKVVRAIRKRM